MPAINSSFHTLKSLLYKFIKYFFVGCLATGIYLGFLYVFTDLFKVYYLVSVTLAFTISTLIGYIGHKYITFRNFERKHAEQLTKFFLIAISGLLLNIGIIYFFVEVLHLWYILGAVIASSIVFVVNFLLNHFLTFNSKKIHKT